VTFTNYNNYGNTSYRLQLQALGLTPKTYNASQASKIITETYDGSIVNATLGYIYGVSILDPTTLPNTLGL
jgi:hypothetical protein